MKVKSVPIQLPPHLALVDLLPDAEIVGWLRGNDGMVGWGRAFLLEVPAAHQFPAAKKAWREVVADADIQDDVGLFGSGLVGFGSFSFDPLSEAGGVLEVPRVLVGRRGKHAWLTTVDTDISPAAILDGHAEPVREPTEVVETAAGLDRLTGLDWQAENTAWEAAVAEALSRLTDGDASKVVLARAVTLRGATPFSPTWVLQRLAHRFVDTWNFAVDSLVGATPELLVSVAAGQVKSLVLAGTAPVPANATDAEIWQIGNKLLGSLKDRTEHAYAVNSVANALAPFCQDIQAEGPEILALPNVLHLATTLRSHYADPQNSVTSLYLAENLHPSAAVCGTPTEAALDIIRDLEPFDRGRYAGPVGWLSATGDGEWGIALRCAQLAGSQARLLAGCGIVAGSQPDAELLESEAKLAPMRWALGATSEVRDDGPLAADAADGLEADADKPGAASGDADAKAPATPTRPKLRLVPE